MTKVKLNLASGQVQEKELITSFINDNIKYIIFDGESTGSMGLPIILVGKDTGGKVVGITDADEWKTAKDFLKKIIAGEKVDYTAIPSELNADDIYYRQLTLPIASFDLLKSSYNPPEGVDAQLSSDNTPIFEPIAPEDIIGADNMANINIEPTVMPNSSEINPVINPGVSEIIVTDTPINNDDVSSSADVFSGFNLDNTIIADNEGTTATSSEYETLKAEFLKEAEELFDRIYKKFNHND